MGQDRRYQFAVDIGQWVREAQTGIKGSVTGLRVNHDKTQEAEVTYQDASGQFHREWLPDTFLEVAVRDAAS